MNLIKSQISTQLENRAYSESTVKIYLYWIDKLIDYHGEKSVSQYREEEISEFLEDLKYRKKLSHSSVRQAMSTMNFIFNKIGKRNFSFASIQAGRGGKKNIVVPSQDEVLKIIDGASTLKNRLALSLIYSLGLDIDELINIRVIDVDFEKSEITIPYRRSNGSRKAIIAEAVKPDLYSYLRDGTPQKWMLENTPGKQVSSRMVQKAFAASRDKQNINPHLTLKSLKYAYVKHMEAMGVSLVVLLDELGLSRRSSLLTYSELDIKVHEVTFSPLDRRLSTAGKEELAAPYVSDARINEISLIRSSQYDLTKVLCILHEINLSHKNRMLLSLPMLIRALLDHIPPIFNCKTFEEVANNYSGTKSFKKSTKHLQDSLRNIADYHLHTQIRKSEVLPTFNQVDFRPDLDLLLSEIVRVNK